MSKWINVREMQSLFLRLFLFFLLLLFFSLENNPLVRLEAIIGLSPSPIEKIFGVKSFFSGMTEGVHQMAILIPTSRSGIGPIAQGRISESSSAVRRE